VYPLILLIVEWLSLIIIYTAVSAVGDSLPVIAVSSINVINQYVMFVI
jgi:hypothetical protein